MKGTKKPTPSDLQLRMVQDMTLRGLLPKTRDIYVQCIRMLARYFRRPPDTLTQTDLRGWVRHLMDRALSSQRLRQHFAAMRMLYAKTLGRPQDVAFLSWPRDPDRLPDVLSADQVKKLLEGLSRPIYRVFCTLLYATGLRLQEALMLGPPRRPAFDIGDIVRQHRGALEEKLALWPTEQRVLSAIALCRTAALGGFIDHCCSCGHEHPAYNSCRNRHCLKCQALAQEEWIAERAKHLLPTRHFHVVFTLPSQLRALCRRAPRSLDGESWSSHERYLFPISMMGQVFRAKMFEALRGMYAQGTFAGFAAFEDPEAFGRLLAELSRLRWVVYTKQPFHRPEHVLQYLGRYTHRVGIANSRLLAVTPTAVTFRTRGQEKVTLHPVAFLRRFLLHVLPDGFHKIRHYGLYASASAKTRWVQARDLLCRREPSATELPPVAVERADPEQPLWAAPLLAFTDRDVRRCRKCGGPVERLPLLRAPPAVAA